jgi:hypothetical protein
MSTMIARSMPPVAVAEATPPADWNMGVIWLIRVAFSFAGSMFPDTP